VRPSRLLFEFMARTAGTLKGFFATALLWLLVALAVWYALRHWLVLPPAWLAGKAMAAAFPGWVTGVQLDGNTQVLLTTLHSGGKFDQVKLLDLGVARIMHASRPSTRSGVMVGTPGYMAPEQARGNKEIDARADIFSMGAVIYECLAGRPVFAGDNIAALLAKILLETPVTLRDAGFDVPPAPVAP